MRRRGALAVGWWLVFLTCSDQAAEPVGPIGDPGDAVAGVTRLPSQYPKAPGGLSGWFSPGQRADLMLSGYGFNATGGALLFNHPRGLASDGTHLFLSDGNNNRVLIWNQLPAGNSSPDLVIGQPDFTTNNPGTGLNQLNWPGQVSVTRDGRVVLADTYNERLLVWNTFPTRNAQPADFEIRNGSLKWPWGAWTDGTRLVASATGGGAILVWLSFPTRGDQAPDLVLSGNGIGTPRTITSDGTFLVVGDHNAFTDRVGNFFWRAFPTTSRAPDFFASDPSDSRAAWMQGDVTADGKLVMLGRYLNIWAGVPADSTVRPQLIVNGYNFRGGDGGGVVFAGGRTYIVMYNANMVVAYQGIPTRADQRPDFAIGSPDPNTNTLLTNYVVTNPVPATDGKSLFVSSDFDRRLLVWTSIPDASGARPDLVYDLKFSPWDNEVSSTKLALAGGQLVAVWSRLPLNAELPDLVYRDQIGSVRFRDLRGVALDDRYFYLADEPANVVYVWRGLPSAGAEPAFTLSVNGPSRLSSDGTYLAVTQTFDHAVRVFRVAELSANAAGSRVGGVGVFNLPQGATVAAGALFVANTSFNGLHVWRNAEDAMASRPAGAILGTNAGPGKAPQIGDATLFWPGGAAFDGSYLWLGEFKFSQRLLRFGVR